jgi:ChAPs (Chs5p-Arf1p-binding proteins)
VCLVLFYLLAQYVYRITGWQVGSDPEIQVATVVSNHLTAGIMKYFGESGRCQQAANLFEKLSAREPEVASLLARSYIGMSAYYLVVGSQYNQPHLFLDEEVKAVQIMAAAMKQTPQSYTLLHVQCDFLRSKAKHEWALKLARQAVNCAPSEFVTWEKLTELYMDLGQYESVCDIPVDLDYLMTKNPGTFDIKLMSNVHFQWPRHPSATNPSQSSPTFPPSYRRNFTRKNKNGRRRSTLLTTSFRSIS